ncbi:MAG: DUF6128 domain-containing protein [Bacteroidales bacterium]|nr:DUF6128 domain-containing protein [Lachnoclostridium sp.]MCM1385521.1 DUF6128 domain-containing protein [Lachnoclostridium sp.]MCM1466308.1 DUF6128 domain-containing protein [Bacteroidales bacterium]
MFYDRKIKYLEDRKDGEHIRTAGFVKAEVRGELCRISIHVAGLYKTDTFEKSIFVSGAGREGKLCDIKIVGGKGDTGELCLPSGRLGEGEIPYEALEEIRIPLAAGRELRCLWKKKGQEMFREKPLQETASEEIEREESISQETIWEEAAPEEILPKETTPKEAMRKETMTKETTPKETIHKEDTFTPVENGQSGEISGQSMFGQQSFNREPHRDGKSRDGGQSSSGEKSSRDSQSLSGAQSFGGALMEDKWQQLCAIYPHIAPFQDEREYLSIEPQDFVIFPVKYYQLVNNSFLLHGYHNYQHLILTRILYRGEIRYYIGVPGNYYEKEKQVAVMFGFESFECKAEPARTGDYGYYMMRIAL